MEKPIRPKKKISVKDSFFRIAERPAHITEEEVTYYRELKVCLVCKGKVGRFNVYICDCDAIYCQNCAKALIDLENACWVCNAPFDETKRSFPFPDEALSYKEKSKDSDKKD